MANKKTGRRINKQGVIDDFFDFFFTFIVGLFMFFFLTFVLNGSAAAADAQAVSSVGQIKGTEAALNNLRVSMQFGENLEGQNLSQRISYSKILGGVWISSCSDYTNEIDCKDDTVGVIPADEREFGNSCVWQAADRECFKGYKILNY